ncbi:MAG: SDR family oxidoreductase [Kiritimatiellae bacterium]|nr:SDR family oxidoreductase [Kiritimatiellia bacterium]
MSEQAGRFKDKVFLVTGGSTGIGLATAQMAAAQGARVAIDARREERCAEAVARIRDAGGEALALPGDVADPRHVEAFVNAAIEKWGTVDVVVANAGINGVQAPVEEITVEEWDRTFNTNMRGTYLAVKYAVPFMKRAKRGSIIAVSSVNGTRTYSNAGYSCYASSKAAQAAFVKTLAVELAQWNIRVNVVCPGATESKLWENTSRRNLDRLGRAHGAYRTGIPLGNRSASAEEVASAILYLAGDEAGYVTGTEFYVDGGLSLG